MVALAERLHKTIPEILQMSCFEFNMWLAYFEQQKQEIEKVQCYFVLFQSRVFFVQNTQATY